MTAEKLKLPAPKGRNTTPADPIDVLLRLLRCNRLELAERLGCNPRTLRRWERDGVPPHAWRLLSELLISTLRAAGSADSLAQWCIDWRRFDGPR